MLRLYKYGIQLAVYIDKENATQRKGKDWIMAIKQRIIQYLQAYKVTGNMRFLLRAKALERSMVINHA
jgi:transposase